MTRAGVSLAFGCNRIVHHVAFAFAKLEMVKLLRRLAGAA